MSIVYSKLKERYLSYEDDLVNDFYKPVLCNSRLYKRMAGYFSSNLFDVLYDELKGTSTFENIKIKIICSPELSSEDKININKGFQYKEILENSIINQIEDLKLDKESLPLITNLIAKGVIDIHFVVNKKGNGIFHAKEGVFYDYQGEKLAFTGSNNETFSAVYHNFETTTVFYGSRHENVINDIDGLFDSIWNNENPNLYQISINGRIYDKFKELDSTLKKHTSLSNESNLSISKNIELYPYQLEAIKNWENNNFSGLFEMATGTGKTITALACHEKLAKKLPSILTIIVVPQIDLVSQWSEDITEFGGKSINCNSEVKGWKNKLKLNMNNLKRGYENTLIVLTTIDTFKSEYFQKTLKNYSIHNSLLIVDEVHTFAANQISTIHKDLEKIFNYKLGVSATPFRKQENETKRLYSFFGEIIFQYTLVDAINNGYLNQYEYYPIILSFSKEELLMYRDSFDDSNGNKLDGIKIKEIERLTSAIANASTVKINKLVHLLKNHDISNPKIIYCSPGLYNDGLNIQDQKHIDFVQRRLGDIGCKLRVIKSGVNAMEREEILKQFRIKDLDTLLAIKCLDQGVNLKNVTHAYILSSTDSLTEFIQRRGRILRIDKNKPISKIYDLVILPQDIKSINFNPTIEDAYLVDRELRRMREYNFASNNNNENNIIIESIEEKYSEVLEDYYAKTRSD